MPRDQARWQSVASASLAGAPGGPERIPPSNGTIDTFRQMWALYDFYANISLTIQFKHVTLRQEIFICSLL
jgi:hypothetical protein